MVQEQAPQALTPAHETAKSGQVIPVTWECRLVSDSEAFRAYLVGRVRARLEDSADLKAFESDCRDLAATGMARETLEKLLCSTPKRLPWEIGEALAECLLEDIEGATLPWNKERDKRTPKASLPGADVVGFIEIGAETFLALGEVKTSTDSAAPPNVMHGRSGMIYQLESLATDFGKHFSILKGLRQRAIESGNYDKWKRATLNYLSSSGRAVVLFGILMRDCKPTEHDLLTRAAHLATLLKASTEAKLIAWYVPAAISSWPTLAEGAVQ